MMNTELIVGMLVVERDKLNRAIAALGGEVGNGSVPVKRLGRPEKTVTAEAEKPAKTGGMTAEGRERQIAAMRKYWATKKAAAKKNKKS